MYTSINTYVYFQAYVYFKYMVISIYLVASTSFLILSASLQLVHIPEKQMPRRDEKYVRFVRGNVWEEVR